jgi:hypothetical protein
MGEFDDLDDVPKGRRTSFGGSKIKWETLLPIIVVVLVVLLIIFRTNIFAAGLGLFSGSQSMTLLVIGSPTQEFRQVLSDAENRDLIQHVRYSDSKSLEHNPYERIKGFDLIIIDQTLQTDKTISRTLGEAITTYVRNGGKLIVVGNSAIERTGDLSVLGWKGTFNSDIVPVGCEPGTRGVPTCKSPLQRQVTIHSAREDHPIMYGILRVPALESAGYLNTETFDVPIYGTEIAYIRDTQGTVYTGIVEKQTMFGGKVLYFNFNPGLSNAIFVNTLQYMK